MFIKKEVFESYIKDFQFKELFNELGWDTVRKKFSIKVNEQVFELDALAEKRDFLIMQCSPQNSGKMPDASGRKKIDREITKHYFEHLLIFIDSEHSTQIWQLSIRESNKPIIVRETTYYSHQKPELLFQKLRDLFFTLDEEDKIGLVDVKQRVMDSFNTNTERVTKQFYDCFKKEHTAFLNFIEGIEENVDKDWYGSLMLNRLMFIYFIQRKGFLDDNKNYLEDKLKAIQQKKGKNQFYSFYKDFILILFHKGLGSPKRNDKLEKEIGRIPYLDGGLFDVHHIEKTYKNIRIKDDAFERVFDFFDQYEWHLDTRITATGRDINPDVLGYIFEKYINDRAAMGAYYTREDITEYISKNTIIPFLFDEVKKKVASAFQKESSLWKMLKDNPDRYIYETVRKSAELDLPDEIAKGLDPTKPKLLERRKAWNKPAPLEFALPTEIWRDVIERRDRYFEIKEKIKNGEISEINDFITYNLDIRQFAQDAVQEYEGSDFINAFYKAIIKISILDPTCGSGAFLFAALNILEPLYLGCIERMEAIVEIDNLKGGKKFGQFRKVLQEIEDHPNEKYYIFKSIILNNLYGVDIMHEAVEIAKLRLFLKLVATVDVDYSKPNLGLEPLPDLDFNLRVGNTLVGFTNLDNVENAFGDMHKIFNKKIINRIKEQAECVKMAYQKFRDACIENDPTLTEAKQSLVVKLKKLNQELDIYQAHLYGVDAKRSRDKFNEWKKSHQPFHWFAEFYEIVQERGGFDVIIGNPPYINLRDISYSFQGKDVSAGDLYGYVILKVLELLENNGSFGFIVMHSLAFSKYFKEIRNELKKINANIWFSFYARIPSGLFSGDVRVRNCILILRNHKKSQLVHTYHTTRIHRWFAKNREFLFPQLSYTKFNFNKVIPMFNDQNEANLFENILGLSTATRFLHNSKYKIYYKQNAYNWIAVSLNPAPCYDSKGRTIHQSQVKEINLIDDNSKKLLLLLLNGKLFFSFWLSYGDEFDVTRDILGRFTFPFSDLSPNHVRELNSLYNVFIKELPSTIKYKLNAGKRVGTYDTSKLWHITDKSDRIFLSYISDDPESDFESIQNHVFKTIITDSEN